MSPDPCKVTGFKSRDLVRIVASLLRFQPSEISADPAKPRVRINGAGWVRHDGDPFPFWPGCVVEAIDELGRPLGPMFAREVPSEWWQGCASVYGRNVIFYRILGGAHASKAPIRPRVRSPQAPRHTTPGRR